MRREASLLIVGGNDPLVLELNRQASKLMEAERRLEIIPGASHLFEDPGTLVEAAARACEWLTRHLTPKYHCVGTYPVREQVPRSQPFSNGDADGLLFFHDDNWTSSCNISPGIDAFARCAAPSTPVMQLIGAPSSCEITHAQ